MIETPALSIDLSREFPVTREKLFSSFTDPDIFARWFVPDKNHRIVHLELDPVAGGRYRLEMVSDQGVRFVLGGQYQIVHPPEELSFTWQWQEGFEDDSESLVHIKFEETVAGARLVLHHAKFRNEKQRQGYLWGWNGALANLLTLMNDQRK